jgi:hypothetical protein
VPEDIPEVRLSIGMAPGAPVMVLGGWVLVPEDGLETLEPTEVGVPVLEVPGSGELELTEVDELREELTVLGFCLSTRWRWRALWTEGKS